MNKHIKSCSSVAQLFSLQKWVNVAGAFESTHCMGTQKVEGEVRQITYSVQICPNGNWLVVQLIAAGLTMHGLAMLGNGFWFGVHQRARFDQPHLHLRLPTSWIVFAHQRYSPWAKRPTSCRDVSTCRNRLDWLNQKRWSLVLACNVPSIHDSAASYLVPFTVSSHLVKAIWGYTTCTLW